MKLYSIVILAVISLVGALLAYAAIISIQLAEKTVFGDQLTNLSPNISKQILVGCCGWSYRDPSEKGGWVGAFYPTANTKKLLYYSKFFRTVEMDSTFYKSFYKYMTPSTFRGMASSSPEGFEFSVKLPETITHDKRLDISKGVMSDLEEFLEKIMSLKIAGKLGVILIQLPPSFTVHEFKNTKQFIDGLPTD